MQYNPIILAIDTDNLDHASHLVKQTCQNIGTVKLGLEFFLKFGHQGVKEISQHNIPIFLDLKLHDIPNTVAKALKAVIPLSVKFITIHAAGGKEMLKYAANIVYEESAKLNITPPILLGVTILTSLDQDDLNQIGIHKKLDEQVLSLAKLCHANGVNGVICSPHEIKNLRQNMPNDFLLITPGIRFNDNKHDDQKRVMTPKDAIINGANHLVVGRAITKSDNPQQAAELIYKEIMNV